MEEIYDTCPFDKSHRILRARMPTHLTKCEKRHTKIGKKRCPFDARHIVDEVEWHHHCNTCPGRESVIHHVEATDDPIQNQLVPIETTPVVQNENWEEEAEVASYNPSKMSEDKPVLRIMVGGSKKERKEFRENERRRRALIENDQERKNKQMLEAAKKEAKSKTLNKRVVDTVLAPEPADQEYKPLRRPKNPAQVEVNTTSKSTNEPEDKPINTKQSTSDGKENINNNSLVGEKLSLLSKTLEDLEIQEEEHKRDQESLDQQLRALKKGEDKSDLRNGWTKVSTKHKKSKNAANFSNF